jgi:HTH-type transcriptional regulator/antitoxin HigA
MSQAPAEKAGRDDQGLPQGAFDSWWAQWKEVTMGVKTVAKMGAYLELVQEFPLTRIHDDKHLERAQEIIDRLLQKNLDRGEQEYLDVLTDLVEAYEEQFVLIPDASEADVLRELIRSNGLSQPKLSKAVGIAQSTISSVLSGSRSLTKDQVVALARFFKVSPAVFLCSG